MPRIMGVDIPPDKPTHISLRYLYGIGPTTSVQICQKLNIDPQRHARELGDELLHKSANAIDLGNRPDNLLEEVAKCSQDVLDG